MGFEPTISAGERPQTYALDRTATGTGNYMLYFVIIYAKKNINLTSNYSQLFQNKESDHEKPKEI